jgi:hypothetical protein
MKEACEMTELESRIAALEAEVRRLRDRAEIADLRLAYHAAVNEKRPEAIGPLFARAGSLDFGALGRAAGRAAIDAFFTATLSDPASFVKQFIHNHAIEIDGPDHATGASYLEARPVYHGESYMVAARYEDEYVREDGRWRFQSMTLVPIFIVPLREGWAEEPRVRLAGSPRCPLSIAT